MQTRYGDLWEVNGFHVIPTNLTLRRDGTAVMGRGVAQQAALRYRVLPDAYGHFPRTRTHPQLFVHRDFQVICLPVKRHWSAHADLDLIRLGVQQLAALPCEIRPIALPLVGCGFGELSSRVVLPLLAQCLHHDRFLLVLRDAAATRRHAATLRPASRRDRSVGHTVPAAIARR